MKRLSKINNIWIIMAGGLEKTGKLSASSKERCKKLIEICKNKNDLVICSSSFTLNKLPIIKNEKIISECSQLRNYLIKKISNPIICEQQSHDTLGSIFFSFLILKNLSHNILNIKIITSDFHKDRVLYIAKRLNKIFFKGAAKIDIIETYTEINIALIKRMSHEKKALVDLNKIFKDIRNLKQLSLYIYLNHSNYNHKFSGRKLYFPQLY